MTVATHNDDLHLLSRAQLREIYATEFHSEPNSGWTAERLVTEIKKGRVLAEQEARKQAQREAEQAERDAVKAARAERKAARGTMEQFADRAFTKDMDDAEQKLSWKVRHALNDVLAATHALTKFVESAANDPIYALEWAQGMVEAQAKGRVAKEFLACMEHGLDASEWAEYASQELGRAANNMSSTSAMHNLTNQALVKAWVEAMKPRW